MKITYCKRCLYPSNAKPTIIFDNDGVCSGCRYHEQRFKIKIDWTERKKLLDNIIEEAKVNSKKNRSSYDCIVPISGGKDSTFQVWYLKKEYNLKILLVSYNHCFNTNAGLLNLNNLVEKSGYDHIKYTAGIDSVKKISRYMLKKVGDLTWHYHAGIRTVPMQIAVEKKIPLVIWGEHGFAELTGLVSLNNFVEYTKWSRKEHDMRGIEAEDLVGKEDLDYSDIAPYRYPNEKEALKMNLRGIYLSNFIDWDYKKNTEKVIQEYGFNSIRYKRDRTFNLFSKIEDHANAVHDYLKYLKFGYGRATDDASTEIRRGRLTREEGKALVKEYDSNTPSNLSDYCKFLGITVEEFYKSVDNLRDGNVWQKKNGNWIINTSVVDDEHDEAHDLAAVTQSNDRVFSDSNANLYYNPQKKPKKTGIEGFDTKDSFFKVV